MKHTPGPWTYCCQTRRPYRVEVHTPTIGGPDIETKYRKEIAVVNSIPDAKLIAAAPELLEACKLAYRYRLITHHGDDPLLAILQNTIRKAEEGEG